VRPIRFTIGNFAAASANNIAASQSVAAGASVILNGTTAGTLDTARQVIITSAGNDSGITFTIVGTSPQRGTITEVLTGANIGVATSLNSFLTVTSITPSGATAAAITVGTNTVADSFIVLDAYANPTDVQLNAVVTGTITFQIDQTLDDIFSATLPSNWFALQASGAVTVQKSTAVTATALRVRVTAFTAGAGNNVAVSLVQAGGRAAA
jgi:hypothetical protein